MIDVHPDAARLFGWTDLHLAVRRGDEAKVRTLLKSYGGATVLDGRKAPPLHHAAALNRWKVAEILLKEGAADPFAVNCIKETAFHVAAHKGHASFLRKLASFASLKAWMNQKNFQGQTPLHCAVSSKSSSLDAIHYLLSIGSPIQAEDLDGNTALHKAALQGSFEKAKILIENGALRSVKNKQGKRPADLAKKAGHMRLMIFLQTWKVKERRSKSSSSSSSSSSSVRNDLKWLRKQALSPEMRNSKLYSLFERAYEEGSRRGQIVSLGELAEIYVKKGEHLRAAHLINGQLSLLKESNLIEKATHRLTEIESLFIRKSLKRQGSLLCPNHVLSNRRMIKKIRDKAHEMIALKQPPEEVQAYLSNEYKKALLKLIQQAISDCGESPPTQFGVLVFGSMARSEMSFYSDVEFAFLLAKSTEKTISYFRDITRIVEFKIINIGETRYDLIRPKRHDLELLPSLSLVPAGLCLDRGGLSPLGKRGIYELIGTPEQLSHYLTRKWMSLNPSEVILWNALYEAICIGGTKASKSLMERYQKGVQEALWDGSTSSSSQSSALSLRKERALQLLKGHLKEFSPRLDMAKVALRAFDVKREMYRPLQMVLSALSLWFKVAPGPAYNQVEALFERGVVSQEGTKRLKSALRCIVGLRLRAHRFYGEEKETLYAPAPLEKESSSLMVIDSKVEEEIQEIYRVLIPLYRAVEAFLRDGGKELESSPLYDRDLGRSTNRSRTRHDANDLNAAVVRAALNPNDTIARAHVGWLQSQLGDHRSAISTLHNHLAFLVQKYGALPHIDLARALFDLGTATIKEGSSRNITYFKDAISVLNGLIHPSLSEQATLYSRSLAETVKKIEKSLYFFSLFFPPDNYLYGTQILSAFAFYNEAKGEFDEAIDQLERAYNVVHVAMSWITRSKEPPLLPDGAYLLAHLSRLYGKRGDLDHALKLRTQAFESLISFYQSDLAKKYRENHINKRADAVLDFYMLNQGLATIQALSFNQPFAFDRVEKIDEESSATLNILQDMRSTFEKLLPSHYEMPPLCLREIAIMETRRGKSMLQRKNREGAIDALRRANSVWEKLCDKVYDPLWSRTLSDLGHAMIEYGNTEKGVEICIKAVQDLKNNFPDALVDRVSAQQQLCEAYEKVGERKRAFSVALVTLRDCDRLPISNCIARAQALHFLGYLYRSKNRLIEALDYGHKAVVVAQSLSKSSPLPVFGVALNGYGSTLSASYRFSEALSYFKRALEVNRKLHGKEPHLSTAATLLRQGLAFDLRDGRPLMPLYREALEMVRAVCGKSSRFTLSIQSWIATRKGLVEK